jgi:tetratricopeptide (TPR) repeat protein
MDTYEKANAEFHEFLDDLLSSTSFQPSKIRILMAGRYPLRHQQYRRFFKKHNDNNYFYEFEFGHFDREETECFLRGIEISKSHEISQIWKITKGYPYHLNLIRKQFDQGHGINPARESNDMVDLILDGLTRTEKEIVALAAYVRWFDQPTIQYLLDEVWKKSDGSNHVDWFDWLTQRDFIVYGSNRYRFDDVTRAVIRRSEFKKNQGKFRATHEAISKYFSRLAEEEISSETLMVEKYHNSDWKKLTSEVIYHALFSNRDRGQVQFLTHFFEGAYFRQPEIAMRVLSTISSEAEPESNELLPQDTRKFVGDREKIECAVMLGWLVVNRRPESYKFEFKKNRTEDDDNNSQRPKFTATIESKIESGLDIFLKQADKLSGIAGYVALLGQSFRCASHRASSSYISKAQIVVDGIAKDSNDSILASSLFRGIGLSWQNVTSHSNAYDNFSAASDLNPESSYLHNLKGNMLYELEKYDEAIDCFTEAIAIDPDNHLPYLGKGKAYINSGRPENAISFIEQAIEIDSTYSDAYGIKGAALIDLGQYDEAVKSLNESIRLNPNNSESFKFKSIALWNLSGPEEAIKNIEEAILLDPKNADLIHQKSCFLMGERKYEESLTEIEEALRINSRDPNILNTKSLCLSLKQCHSQALDTIRKAISVESSSKQFLLIANCGIVLARAGKHLEAVSTCNSVIETNPSDEAGYYGIACCYALQGNYGMALASLQEAININSMRCRREARKNPDFDRLRNDEHFILMTTERTSTS